MLFRPFLLLFFLEDSARGNQINTKKARHGCISGNIKMVTSCLPIRQASRIHYNPRYATKYEGQIKQEIN